MVLQHSAKSVHTSLPYVSHALASPLLSECSLRFHAHAGQLTSATSHPLEFSHIMQGSNATITHWGSSLPCRAEDWIRRWCWKGVRRSTCVLKGWCGWPHTRRACRPWGPWRSWPPTRSQRSGRSGSASRAREWLPRTHSMLQQEVASGIAAALHRATKLEVGQCAGGIAV